jgi:hypothetical protein
MDSIVSRMNPVRRKLDVELGGFRAPSTWKDPAKIEAEIDRQRAELLAEHQARLQRCALDWNLNRILISIRPVQLRA